MRILVVQSLRSSSGPSSAIATYVARAVALDTTQVSAVMQSGAPPAPAGGPTATVTTSAGAAPGSPNLLVAQSASPFQTVYIAAGSASGTTIQPTDYLQITLSAPVTSVPIALTYPASLPAGNFTLRVQVASANGAAGPIASVNRATVAPAVEPVGIVYATWIGTPARPGDRPDPVAGATVSTSLDSTTAVTGADGLFDLKATVSTTSCFTITITAPGLRTYSAQRRFGSDSIVAYTLGSTPQFLTPTPCS